MCAKAENQVIERNKESLLRKHAKGSTEEPHWNEELASDAEAFVSRPNLELVERRQFVGEVPFRRGTTLSNRPPR